MNHALLSHIRELVSFGPWRITLLAMVSALNGLTQGIGFFMLIPLLHLFGIGAAQGNAPPHWIGLWLTDLFQRLHIPVSLILLLVVFFVLTGIAAVLKYFQAVLVQKFQRAYVCRLQTRMFGALVRARWEFTAGRSASRITHVITQDMPVVATGCFFFLHILSGIVLACCYAFWAATVSVRLTVLALGTAGLAFFLFRSYFPRAFRVGQVVRQAGAGMFSALMDNISGVKIIKSYGAEEREYRNFAETAERMSGESVRVVRENARMGMWFQVLSNLVLCLILYVALEILGLPLVMVGISVLIFSRLIPLLSNLQSQAQHLASMLPAFEAAQRLYLSAIAGEEKLEDREEGTPLKLTKGIRLENVSFSYGSDGRDAPSAVRHLNLHIPAKKVTVVHGPSGSGKSTLADLLAGLLAPDSGTVRVDGIPLDRSNLRAWRSQAGYVPQEVILFNGTIRDNIRLGNPHARDEDIIAALEAANAARFVAALPNGPDTNVQDRGERLSGGERQRIALARTLVRNPVLLILDEATNSLDRETEAAVFEALSRLRGRVTIVLISHGKAALDLADHVIRMDRAAKQPA